MVVSIQTVVVSIQTKAWVSFDGIVWILLALLSFPAHTDRARCVSNSTSGSGVEKWTDAANYGQLLPCILLKRSNKHNENTTIASTILAPAWTSFAQPVYRRIIHLAKHFSASWLFTIYLPPRYYENRLHVIIQNIHQEYSNKNDARRSQTDTV